MILLLLTSIIGIILHIICLCLFHVDKCNAEIILNGIIASIPIIGVSRFLHVLINGILYHVHPLNNNTNLGLKTMWFSNALVVRDIKLNRWLFNDIDWKAYDILKKNLDNLNQI